MTTILTVFLTNGQHIVEKFTHLKRTEAIKLARTVAKEGYTYTSGDGLMFYPSHSIFKTSVNFHDEPKHSWSNAR